MQFNLNQPASSKPGVVHQAIHPELRLAVAPHLNAYPLLVEILLERLREAETT
ncbi:MAG: hypothetical protein KDJ70_04500 [Candidatus Competibacteraceae bacterium]|nr:hypothetical protein [Candidatus Competibacteraceae bacterium]